MPHLPAPLTRLHSSLQTLEQTLTEDGWRLLSPVSHAGVWGRDDADVVVRLGGDAPWRAFHAHVLSRAAAGDVNPHLPVYAHPSEPAPGVFACVMERLQPLLLEDAPAVVDPMLYWLLYRGEERRMIRYDDHAPAEERRRRLAAFEARCPLIGDALAGLAAARDPWRWDIKRRNVMWRTDAAGRTPVVIDPFAR